MTPNSENPLAFDTEESFEEGPEESLASASTARPRAENALRRYMIERRREMRLSQRELAIACDLPLGTVAGLESGRLVNAPRPHTLEKLAQGLKTTYESLDALVRGLSGEGMAQRQRWEEDYYYRLFDAFMRSDRIPETEKLMLQAKLRTLWQQHGDYEIPY